MPAFVAVRRCLAMPDVRSALAEASSPERSDAANLDTALAEFERQDDARSVAHRVVLASELLWWMVARTRREPWVHADAFLLGLLAHPPEVTPPGLTWGQFRNEVIEALVHAYAGGEEHLVKSLELMPLDIETRLEMLTAGARAAPEKAAEVLRAWVDEALQAGGIEGRLPAAIEVIARGLRSEATVSWLRRLAQEARPPGVRVAAVEACLRWSDDPQDRLLALNLACRDPALRDAIRIAEERALG
jgi:hypothetical protein